MPRRLRAGHEPAHGRVVLEDGGNPAFGWVRFGASATIQNSAAIVKPPVFREGPGVSSMPHVQENPAPVQSPRVYP